MTGGFERSNAVQRPQKDDFMDKEQIEEIAKEVSKETIRQTFAVLGVNADDQDSLNKLRSDLVSARNVRTALEAAGKKGLLTFVGLIVVMICAAVAKYIGFMPKG